MAQEFTTYRKFPSVYAAIPLIEYLQEKEIPYELADHTHDFDPLFTYNRSGQAILVKIHAGRFEEVSRAQKVWSEAQVSEISDSHYLRQFTVRELVEILKTPDEWSEPDYQGALVLLESQGINVTEDELLAWREARQEELARGTDVGRAWIRAAWILVFVFPLASLAMGIAWKSASRTLSNGTTALIFSPLTRKTGGRLFLASAVMIALGVLFFLVRGMS